MATFVLYELASGYALFERLQSDEIGRELESVQESMKDLSKFSKVIKIKSFIPFKNAADALQNCNSISEGVMSDSLQAFLEMNFPKSKKKSVVLGVGEKILAGAIKSTLSIDCDCSEETHELLRGIRTHLSKLVKQLSESNIEKAQLGLGHGYSRAKVKFNVNRSDNMVIQAISMLDQLDKDINTFSMRIREWYSWHFPELVKIVSDNCLFARCAQFVMNKSRLSETHLEDLESIVQDGTVAKNILNAARSSMGTDISDIDMMNIETFARKVISLFEYRKELQEYLYTKMHNIAPNLSALIGEIVGARLISHAGSLTNLSKYPASTVQILGAEKALFRALKTRGNTPKYGIIYHSSFIGRAGLKNKGRISRYLANKCSMASRIDCYSDKPTSKFGEAMKQQVDDRIVFYETGQPVSTNEEVMSRVVKSLESEEIQVEDDVVEEVSSKKRKAVEEVVKQKAKVGKKEKTKVKSAEVIESPVKVSAEGKVKKEKSPKKEKKEKRKSE